jgi:CP family cyanate transporter-like MFS transporter
LTGGTPAGRGGVGPVVWLVAIVLVALNLRPAIASVPPLIDLITGDLRLSATAAGLLTTVPVVCMGLFALVAPPVARRIGPDRVVTVALVLIAVGTAARAFGAAAGLYAGAVVAGVGIAIGGVLLPALVKARFPDRVGPVTGLYTCGLIGGALIAAAGTEPLRIAFGLSWEVVLALWALPAVATLLVWLQVARGSTVASANEPAPWGAAGVGPGESPWRNRTAWLATIFMGGQSLLFYGALAWLAARYTSLGLPATQAGLLLGAFSATQLVSALGLPALAHRRGDTRPWIAASVAASTVALALIALAPTAAPWAWAALLGLGMGGHFALALTVLADISPTPTDAAAVSGMAFFVGYLVAAAGPVAAGALRDVTGSFVAPFLALTVVGLLTLVAGVAAGGRRVGRSSAVGAVSAGRAGQTHI